MQYLKPASLSFAVRLLAVAAIVPAFMLLYGYFGDDYQFHLSSWVGIVQDWRSGVGYPSWLAGANYNLGEPRFFFYPPSSVWIGAMLAVILPLRLVPALYVFLVTILAGLSMRKLASHLVPEHQNAAALLYCTSYYLVANGVLRYAIAEALVAAFLPLLVLFYLRVMTERRGLLHPLLSVLLALAWLTNLPAALVIFYVLLFGCVIYAVVQRSGIPVLKYALAQAVAVGLSAWYLLPAVLAKGQVAAAGIQGKFPWHAYTLFQNPRNPLARSLTYPLWFWCLGGVALLLLWLVRQRFFAAFGSSPQEKALWLTGVLGCLPLLFVTPWSGLLWNHLPELSLVAFSWRFFPFLCLGLSLLLPVIFTKRWARGAALAIWIMLMCIPLLERVAHRHVHGRPETFATTVRSLDDGFEGFEEYLPAGVDAKPGPGDFQGTISSPSSPTAQACSAQVRNWKAQEKEFTSSDTGACDYVLNLFYFPEWHATMDADVPLALKSAPDHRIQVLLPPGNHHVRVVFTRPVRPVLYGSLVTILAALLLLASRRVPFRGPELQDALDA